MREDRTGEENYNKYGTLIKIVEYNKYSDIWVEFQDEYKAKVHTSYQAFKRGNVKNPYDKTVHKVGYLGIGKYNYKDHYEIYKVWIGLIQRCYDPYFLDKHPTYRDCIVCEEWHNFQNFAEWYEENVYNCNNERMHLDKDILYKNNKIYSPGTCLIVPQRINSLFVKRDNDRGEYPIGVNKTYNGKILKLVVQCNTLEKRECLGYFPLNRPFQAFYTYKIFKEKYIKQVADEYKNLIPKELYEALYKYEVEIND